LTRVSDLLFGWDLEAIMSRSELSRDRYLTCVRRSVVLALVFLAGAHNASAQFVNGSSAACTDFRLVIVPSFLEFDIADEGWVWLQAGDPSLPR